MEDRARRGLGMHPVALTDEAREAIERLGADAVVRALLDGLPADQAEAVETRVVHEQSYEEIAARMQCSPSAVRKRVSRGLAALRATFKETG